MKKIRIEVRKNFPILPENSDRAIDKFGNEIRQSLTVRWDSGNNNVVAIGINPSVASTGVSDNTVTRLCRFIDIYGYNSLTLINLFEGVSTNQNGLVQLTETDFNKHRGLFESADIILVVWGRTQRYKSRIKAACSVLNEYSEKVYCIAGNDSKTNTLRYPLHPSRISYKDEIVKFNVFNVV